MAAASETPKPKDPGAEPAKMEPREGPRDQSPQQRTDRAIRWIKENDPNKARELEGLRTSDPNRFNKEMREYFRDRMRGEGFDWSLLGPGDFGGPEGPGRQGGPGGQMGRFGEPGMGGDPRAAMDKERDEFLKWMTANYPEEGKKLTELRKNEKDMAKVDRQTMQNYRQYITIYVASKYNPKLAEILKQDLPLRKERRDLSAAIDKTTDAAEKAKLTDKLHDVVARRFDLLIQQKQIEYDILLERLKTVQKQIEDSKSKLEDMKQNSKQHIDKQMSDLLSHKDRPPRN
jgi:hypothetical protein